MTSDAQGRRKRVFFRCHHTGMKENDLLLGAFANAHLSALSDAEVAWLEWFLASHNDLDIYEWITGRKPPPGECDHSVFRLIQQSVAAA